MKDAYYFSHDCGARNDPKILQLRLRMGWEGYGLFFAFVEVLREQTECKFPSNATATLELGLSISKATLEQFLDTCVTVGLLVNDGEFIYSDSLNKRMVMKEEAHQRRVNAGRKGGIAKALVKQCLASKGKKRKEKKTTTYTEKFESFWKEYPRKKAKPVAFKAWQKIDTSNGKYELILNAVKAHKKSSDWIRDDGQYIPHPTSWLNQNRWEDEVTQPSNKTAHIPDNY